MKETILALLRAKFEGVRNDGLVQLANSLALTATDEARANEIIGQLTADQVNAFVTDYRREVDSETSKANKTFEQNLKGKFDFVEKNRGQQNPPANNEQKPADDISTIIQNAISPLVQKINALENEKQFEKLSSIAKLKLKEKGIPETFVGSINLQNENEIESFIQSQEERYNLFRQEAVSLGNWTDKPKGGTDRSQIEAEAIGRKMAEQANAASVGGKPLA